ncbi:unnamed protein product [Lactuca saligna]|uniref:Jacalin-type lectin domain-containing protein n=1 Tax=Lactuca saligna TaxID=75948 RepID=A0AA35Y9S3_LACSI|nr:unnamed protein product [Lactuca saligna]
MKLSFFNTFSAIAYQCLKPDRNERPKMAHIVEELEKVYNIQAGGRNGGGTVSEKKFDENEELTCIKGTIKVLTSGHTTISSLTFITNDKTRGPFGRKIDTPFYILWEKGNFGGFYGLAHNIIDDIGVYMKSSSDVFTRVGKWGMKSHGCPDNQWSFRLQKNHRLKEITIDHGYLIYFLMFTTEFRGEDKTSEKKV